MSLFGIPLIIPYEYYVEFINTNFPTILLTDDGLFICYIILNGIYIFLIYLFIRFCYKALIWLKNEVFD